MRSVFKKWITLSAVLFSFSQIFAGDATITKLSLLPYLKTNSYKTPKGQIVNLSGSNITSIRTGWRLDNGTINNDIQTTIGGTGLPAGGSIVNFTSISGFTTSVVGNHVLKVWVKATGDTNASNDTITFNFTALSSYADKVNLFEESSGTWCQYCPAAATVVASIKALPKTAVAVFHRTDIYSTTEGDDYFFDYFPSDVFTPGGMINMSEKGAYAINAQHTSWLQEMNDRANGISPVEFSISPTYTSASRQLNVNVTSRFKYIENGEYFTNVYIVEDGIVGTQVNATNPYTHDNVVRKMLGGPDGTPGIIPTTPVLNTDYTNSYTFTIPTGWNVNNLRLIGMVYKKTAGFRNTLNAAKYEFSQLLSTKDFTLSPNPAHDFVTISDIGLSFGDTVSVYNLGGQLLQQEVVNPESTELNISELPFGMYLIKVKTNEGIYTKKLIKQ